MKRLQNKIKKLELKIEKSKEITKVLEKKLRETKDKLELEAVLIMQEIEKNNLKQFDNKN